MPSCTLSKGIFLPEVLTISPFTLTGMPRLSVALKASFELNPVTRSPPSGKNCRNAVGDAGWEAVLVAELVFVFAGLPVVEAAFDLTLPTTGMGFMNRKAVSKLSIHRV